jgi:CRISPR-associated protein Cas2
MFWVVSYDIVDDSRRRKVVKVLEGYGIRGQYSVFECDMSDREQMTLQAKLREVIDLDEDDVRFYPLNQTDIKRAKTLGKQAKLNFLNDAEII